MQNDLVIVYGTLRVEAKTQMSKLLDEQAQLIGTGHFLGKLFEVDGFPGAIESTNDHDKIYGDIFEINPDILESLDNYEECSEQFPRPHEYLRKKVLLHLPNGLTELGWVYIYNRETEGLFRIQSGDYLKYQNNTIS
jgi:gamma-glutamylcyclotransferase (GGCT)/AIG2-like uncharacterized protein YtfP